MTSASEIIASDCNQFLLKRKFEVNKNQIFSGEKMKNLGIVFMIMLTRSSERIFNPMRYAGYS